MNYKIENGNIQLIGDETYHHRQFLKQIGFKSKYLKKQFQYWYCDLNFDMITDLQNFISSQNGKITGNILTLFDDPEIKQILPIIQSLVNEPEFKTELYDHQKQSVKKGLSFPVFYDGSEPGTGKTRVQLEIILQRNEWPVLIICPKSIIKEVWQKQIEQILKPQLPEVEIILLDNTSLKDIKKIDDWLSIEGIYKKSIFIVNYEKSPLIIDFLLKIYWRIIILDESTRIANHKAKRSKAIMRLRDISRNRSIMTGTISSNGLLSVFNQIRFLEPYIFGEDFYAFRNRYFYDALAHTKAGFPLWKPKAGIEEIIRNKLKSIGIQHKKRECLDLPPLIHEVRNIEMDKEQAKIYNEMRKYLIIEIEGKEITAQFAASCLNKLRQICSGFIYDQNKTAVYLRKVSPKINELKDILDDLSDAQVIVFAHFTETLNWLYANIKDKSSLIYSEIPDKKRSEEIQKFESGESRVMLANPATVAHGFNWQFCSNIIYYEHDFSLENYLQSMQRIERIGQENKMTIFHLLLENSIENYIYKRLSQKEETLEGISINELKTILEMQ